MLMCSTKHAPGNKRDGWTSWWNLQESWLTLIRVQRRHDRNSCFGSNLLLLALGKELSVRSTLSARAIMPLCDVLTATNTHVANAEERCHGSAVTVIPEMYSLSN